MAGIRMPSPAFLVLYCNVCTEKSHVLRSRLHSSNWGKKGCRPARNGISVPRCSRVQYVSELDSSRYRRAAIHPPSKIWYEFVHISTGLWLTHPIFFAIRPSITFFLQVFLPPSTSFLAVHIGDKTSSHGPLVSWSTGSNNAYCVI